MKNSKKRNAVIEVFSSCKKHVTVDELFDASRKVDPDVGYTTVWRTLKKLESLGIASAQKFHDGQTRYEYIAESNHHDHMICTKCGHVEEFMNAAVEKIQSQLAKSHNFKMTSHKMELYGYCRKCKK